MMDILTSVMDGWMDGCLRPQMCFLFNGSLTVVACELVNH